MADFDKQLAALMSSMQAFASNDGARRSGACATACSELLAWTHLLRGTFSEAPAIVLLDGARAAMLESCAYLAVGLARAAVGAMRLQVDLLLGFSYFVDHPREWEYVCSTGSGFQLKGGIDKYHASMQEEFIVRLKMLDGAKKETRVSQVYGILSAHIHGQSTLTIPRAGVFAEVVSTPPFVDSVVRMQEQVAVAVSNYLAVVFDGHGIDPPEIVMERIAAKLSSSDRRKVFPL